MPQLRVNGIDLSYTDQGTGPPVVFVHGAWMDLRYWEPQRQAIAMQYRFLAYTQRYHGTAPWPDAGQQDAAATHAADLVAFLRQLHPGPVHLVGLSSGGRLVTLVALPHPDVVRSLTALWTTCWSTTLRPADLFGKRASFAGPRRSTDEGVDEPQRRLPRQR